MMTQKISRTVLLTSILAISATSAQAGTITFDEFQSDFYNYAFREGATFQTKGYDFKVTEGGGVWIVDLSTYSNTSRNGTPTLDLGATVSITNPSKRPFSVSSIDLAPTLALETSWISLIGTDVNGNQTTEILTVNNSLSNLYGFTTARFTGFNNLTSFEMKTHRPDPDAAAYWTLVDNIVINDVPEPPTWALLGTCLVIGMALLRCKSQ